jgi:3-oxoacyl-[acyl-carrier-protein] synthase II
MRPSDIVITGVGALSCRGIGWRCLLPMTKPPSQPSTSQPTEIPGLQLEQWIEPNRLRRMDRTSALLVVAARQAAEHAGLELTRGRADGSIGVCVGTCLGSLDTSVRYARRLNSAGIAATNPIDFPDSIDGAAAAHVAMELGCEGPSSTHVEFELSAECALLHGVLDLVAGRADRMLVVAGDAMPTSAVPRLTKLLGAERSTPLVEGAAALVLERRCCAADRGAPVLARLVAYDCLTLPTDDPTGVLAQSRIAQTLEPLDATGSDGSRRWLHLGGHAGASSLWARAPRLANWERLPTTEVTGLQPSGGLLRLVDCWVALQASPIPSSMGQLLYVAEDHSGQVRLVVLELS